MPAKQMPRCKRAELIRLHILCSGEQTKPLGWDHVMQVAPLTTN